MISIANFLLPLLLALAFAIRHSLGITTHDNQQTPNLHPKAHLYAAARGAAMQ